MIEIFLLKLTLDGDQIDSYMNLLDNIQDFITSNPPFAFVGSGLKVLFLRHKFLEVLLQQGNKEAFKLMGEKDPLAYAIIIMPLRYHGSWRLVIADHRHSYYKITYFDCQDPRHIPSFISKISEYFGFDFCERQKRMNYISKPLTYAISTHKEINFDSSMTDIFICQVAREFVLTKSPKCFFPIPYEILRNRMVMDMRLVSRKSIEFLVRNILQNK